jgi:hypothetical protein
LGDERIHRGIRGSSLHGALRPCKEDPTGVPTGALPETAYWAGPNAKEFAPSGKSFNDPNWQEAYLELISDRYPTEKALAAAIRPHLETREKVVFLCFERNPDACHRRLFALYIELMLGVAVPEFPVEMEIHTEPDPEEAGGEPKPGSLFDI